LRVVTLVPLTIKAATVSSLDGVGFGEAPVGAEDTAGLDAQPASATKASVATTSTRGIVMVEVYEGIRRSARAASNGFVPFKRSLIGVTHPRADGVSVDKSARG
jgi:hypothetical protein